MGRGSGEECGTILIMERWSVGVAMMYVPQDGALVPLITAGGMRKLCNCDREREREREREKERETERER